MIVPTKGVHPNKAMLTVGGQIVNILNEPMTVSKLWTSIRNKRSMNEESPIGFDWFVLSLDLVKILGLVDLGEDGYLVRRAHD